MADDPKLIPKCSSCGEPISDGYTFCDRCIAEINEQAMTLMKRMIKGLGLVEGKQ